MVLLSSNWLYDTIIILTLLVICLYLNFNFRTKRYWSVRNFPSENPLFIFGNTKQANVSKRISDVVDELYFKHKKNRVTGVWLYVKPTLLITDLGIMKDMLITNFSYFHDRGITVHEDMEPLTAHLFNISGKKWRNLRVKLAPTFTSGKMKLMFNLMLEVGMKLQQHIKQNLKDAIEVREMMACYTTDVISSCAFGVEANSLNDSNNEFRRHGRKIFGTEVASIIAVVMNFVAPKLQKLLRLKQIPKDTTVFLMKAVRDIMDYREKNNVMRKDFMSLMIELKNKGRIEDPDRKSDGSDIASDLVEEEFTLMQATAQSFVFFFAGFETSGTTLTNTMYELAVNPEIQKSLHNEIDEALRKSKREISYNTLQEMYYMDCVVQETLRKYPPVPLLFRECTKSYTIPGTQWVIEKGESIVMPISAIHSDPEYFPEPNKYDPERFSHEMMAQRDPFLSLGFGAGPRICIGSRFGILQVKVALATILSKFNVEVCKETQIPMQLDPRNFFPAPLGGLRLKFSLRT